MHGRLGLLSCVHRAVPCRRCADVCKDTITLFLPRFIFQDKDKWRRSPATVVKELQEAICCEKPLAEKPKLFVESGTGCSSLELSHFDFVSRTWERTRCGEEL